METGGTDSGVRVSGCLGKRNVNGHRSEDLRPTRGLTQGRPGPRVLLGVREKHTKDLNLQPMSCAHTGNFHSTLRGLLSEEFIHVIWLLTLPSNTKKASWFNL